ILFFDYTKKVDHQKKETIYSDGKTMEFIQYKNGKAKIRKIEKSTDTKIEGEYEIIESIPPDTLILINYYDYGEQATIIRERLKKIGVWRTFDKNGKLLGKKNY
ncbi:MAG: hypothetical protein AAF599_15355, partial [Bacteroidota bacterium]